MLFALLNGGVKGSWSNKLPYCMPILDWQMQIESGRTDWMLNSIFQTLICYGKMDANSRKSSSCALRADSSLLTATLKFQAVEIRHELSIIVDVICSIKSRKNVHTYIMYVRTCVLCHSSL